VDKVEQLWRECLDSFNIDSAIMLSQSTFDPFRRVYVADGLIYKVVVLRYEISKNLRVCDLAAEFAILKYCAAIPGVPLPITHYQNDEFEALVMKRLPGQPLDTLDISWMRLFLILVKLSIILLKLSWRGISHNDILPRNVLVTSQGSISLIDFDQATRTNFFVALLRQFAGIKVGSNKVYGSVVSISKKCVKKKLSPKTIQFLRKFCRRNDSEALQILPSLPNDVNSQLKTLLKAWRQAQVSDASSPGRRVAYYSLDLGGYHFPGERPWIERWNMLRSAADYSDKRILELGCNMALLSCFLLKDLHASAALAVDADAKILEAAEQVSLAFCVKPILKCQDFDAVHDWETELFDFKPDVVFALNVLNWVKDKQRFLDFLGHFQEVIYEGHDSIDVESKRLHDVGFRYIDLVGISERRRVMLHCQK